MKKSAVKNLLIFSTALFSATIGAQNKLALVIDDIGYHSKEDAAVLAMPTAVSVAIIPSAPYARARNQEAHAQGRDVLIHLPMQPMSNIKIEDGGLHLGMSASQVAQRVDTAKQIVSHAIGMNNHMGSAATADRPLMTALMQALRERQLFFLDNRTIGRSVATAAAKEQGVKALERHIFLDDSDKFDDVQRQFQAAVRYAQKHRRRATSRFTQFTARCAISRYRQPLAQRKTHPTGALPSPLQRSPRPNFCRTV